MAPARRPRAPPEIGNEPAGTERGPLRACLDMTETISLPVWIVLAAGALALWALVEHLFVPGVRWFLRRHVNRVITELNTRLQLQVTAFHRTKRQVLIDRLTGDPEVMSAIETEAQASKTPREVLIREVERYAREIVPSFNAYLYFRIGYRLARSTARLLYRVRLGYSDDEALSRIAPDSSVVFVMNHRSNVDYVIVAYMAAKRSALSYAVGEWARIWPLHTLLRSLGAYFVRRNSSNLLYRRVLARYVHAATAGGVVQALYPEGGLSRDGLLHKPRLGLISYMVAAFDPDGDRDLVFIPVGINYDRVLEDRTLVRGNAPGTGRRARGRHAAATLLTFIARNLYLMLRRRWYRFGYACVNFASPISMRSYTASRDIDFRTLGPEIRREALEKLGGEIENAIAAAIPVLPVSVVASVFTRRPAPAMSALEIKAEAQSLIDELERRGAYVHIPRADRDYAVTVGLRMLALRHFVEESEGLYRARDGEQDMLRYYANSIEHFLRD